MTVFVKGDVDGHEGNRVRGFVQGDERVAVSMSSLSFGKILKEIEEKNKDRKDIDIMNFWKSTAKGTLHGYDPEKHGSPSQFVEKALDKLKKQTEYYREGAVGQAEQAKEIELQKENAESLETYGLKRSVANIARLGIYAYEKEKQKKLDRPLYIAPENVFPEHGYGSHPDELKELIIESRKAMVGQLIEKKIVGDKKEAEKIANDHIKATFDIAHANTWRKYFKGSDKEFKQWVDQQVQGLLKDKIIGHVHITDNFGYHDEHLTPGEGTAPIKEFLQRLETEGYKGTIVAEPGGQSEGQLFRTLTGAWGLSDYPMYRVDRTGLSWTDVQGSYFGRTESPRFVVGDYAPSKEWTLWSEVPLE